MTRTRPKDSRQTNAAQRSEAKAPTVAPEVRHAENAGQEAAEWAAAGAHMFVGENTRWQDFLYAVTGGGQFSQARTHDGFPGLFRASLFAVEILNAARVGFELINNAALSTQDEEALRRILLAVAAMRMNPAEAKQLATRMENLKRQPLNALADAHKARHEDSEALTEVIGEIRQQHPDWSYREIADELRKKEIVHKKNRKPYTSKTVGNHVNKLLAAERANRKHTR